MKRLMLAGVLAATASLAACEEPRFEGADEVPPPPAEAAPAPAAEEASAPAAATAPAATTPVDPTTLPADKRTSEETVQPESETLFY